MAAALFRRGSGLCCIHRELCRVVWRPQTALFCSKTSDRNPPRRTHIKKAKPQPAIDVTKLLERLFSQRRPGTAPPAGKAPPTNPPSTSSTKVSTSNAPLLSKTEPAASVFPAASSFKQVAADNLSNVTVRTSASSPTSTTAASLASEAATETIETKETAKVLPSSAAAHMVEEDAETSSRPAATVEETLVETIIDSQVEPELSPVETLQVRAAVVEGPVEPTVNAPAEEIQRIDTDSGVSYVTKEEALIDTTVEPAVETSHFHLETLESEAAVVEGPVEPTMDKTKSTDLSPVNLSHAAKEEDPVQRLFLEKIKEYNNMRRLNGGAPEVEPDYEKCLSEETAKLQRLYGGGDLSSFPQFTFAEPEMHQDSK